MDGRHGQPGSTVGGREAASHWSTPEHIHNNVVMLSYILPVFCPLPFSCWWHEVAKEQAELLHELLPLNLPLNRCISPPPCFPFYADLR